MKAPLEEERAVLCVVHKYRKLIKTSVEELLTQSKIVIEDVVE